MMNAGNGLLNSFMNRPDSSAYSAGRFSWANANYAKSENADITIVTDDGDRVTISTDSSMESSYSSYSGLLRSGSNSIMAEGYEYQGSLKSNFSLSIVGDLDSQEYDDIISALGTIDSIMEKVSSGNLGDLESIAKDFGGLESISSLNASIEVKESLSYEQARSSVMSGTDSSQNMPQLYKDISSLDNDLLKILDSGKNNGKSVNEIMRYLDEYMTGLLDLLSKKEDNNERGRKTGELLKGMILNRLAGKEELGTH